MGEPGERDWLGELTDVVNGFCDAAPIVFADAAASAHVTLHARRLQIAFGSLRDAPFEKQLPAEAAKLIQAGAARIRTLQRELTAASFAAPLTSLASLSEVALVERFRAAPIDDVYRFVRVLVATPSELSVFDQVSRAALFAELGITVQLGIFEWIKLILLALCFVVLAIFGAAALPFVLFVAAALAAIDKAGEIIPKEGPGAAGGAGGGGPNPPAGSGTGPTVIHYDDGDIIYPGPNGGPILWKPKNGPPQVIWPRPSGPASEPGPTTTPPIHGLSGKAGVAYVWEFCTRMTFMVAAGHTMSITFSGSANAPGQTDAVIEVTQDGKRQTDMRPGERREFTGFTSIDVHCGGGGGAALVDVRVS